MGIGSFRKLPLQFRCGESESGIGLVMGGNADRTLGVLASVIVVMERLPQKGEKHETYKDE